MSCVCYFRYRTQEEVWHFMKERDPITQLRNIALGNNLVTADELQVGHFNERKFIGVCKQHQGVVLSKFIYG